MSNHYHRSALAELFPRVLKRKLGLGKKRKKDFMVQNVMTTLDLGKGINLERLQLSFHGAPLAILDYMSDSKAGVVSMVKLDKCYTTIHLFLLSIR
jgi:TATA-box binding protein (TBP) (component of TFIID and TFIIIB)